MQKVKIYQLDGKTREERESCFPMPKQEIKNKNKGAGM